MLAVLHGLEKFHYYAHGREVTIETDHKLLEAIFKKRLSTAPPHIARVMLRIQKYDVEIKYVQVKKIPLADALSRISPCPGDTIEGLDVSLHEMHLHLNATLIPQGSIRLRKKQPRMRSSSHFIPLSPKDGPTQDQTAQRTFTHSGIIVMS